MSYKSSRMIFGRRNSDSEIFVFHKERDEMLVKFEDILQDLQATEKRNPRKQSDELLSRSEDEHKAIVMTLRKRIDDLQAYKKDVIDSLWIKEAEIKITEHLMEIHENDKKIAEKNAELFREEERKWKEKREIMGDTHIVPSAAQAGCIGLTVLGAFLTPLVPPVGIFTMAAGAGKAASFAVAKAEFTDQIERCETEAEKCDHEVERHLHERNFQFHLHGEKTDEHNEMREIQKYVENEISFLMILLNQEVQQLEQLKEKVRKKEPVESKTRKTTDKIRESCHSNTPNHIRAMSVLLSDTIKAVNDVPGVSSGLQERWEYRIKSAVEKPDFDPSKTQGSRIDQQCGIKFSNL